MYILNKFLDRETKREQPEKPNQWSIAYQLRASKDALSNEEDVRVYLTRYYNREYSQMTNNKWDHFEIEFIKLDEEIHWEKNWFVGIVFYKFVIC